ncbi:MAG: hypothetical protein OHK0029_13420 [Armatimonadaceae bacterium]
MKMMDNDQSEEIAIREIPQNNCVVLEIRGEVDLQSCSQLEQVLRRWIEGGQRHLVLDMAGVPYVDSSALGVLVNSQRLVQDAQGRIYLARLTPFVERAFEITRLIRLFPMFDSVEEAVQFVDTREAEKAE